MFAVNAPVYFFYTALLSIPLVFAPSTVILVFNVILCQGTLFFCTFICRIGSVSQSKLNYQ